VLDYPRIGVWDLSLFSGEETRKFFRMLASRSEEARKHPDMLIRL